MTVQVKYKRGKKEYFFLVDGEDIEVDLITETGLEIVQIPSEEGTQGFRAKERMDKAEE